MTVAEGAADALIVAQPGQPRMPWNAGETPYMVEPMNMLASRIHEAVCFVGPARTGKTLAFTDAWMAHCVVNDPGDMLVVQMSQDKAREFSKTRVDRALKHSPKLAELKSMSAHHDNTHDKVFKHGMWLRLGWPTATNLSGSDYRYVAIPDYDRTKDDVDGEGSKFQLALKRTQTFMSRGMCAAESSPGRPVVDPKWQPRTPHEAPPVGTPDEGSGILGIYNSSDRRRWYWKCYDCRAWFEAAPGLSLFNLPPEEQLIELVRETNLDVYARERAYIYCPHCGSRIEPRFKAELNRKRARWLADGQSLTTDDELIGEAMTSSVAGFWLGGVAAAYQSWERLINKYLQGLRDYVLNGSEQGLQTTTNVDQGMPYTSRHLAALANSKRSPKDRVEPDMQRFMVPDQARFLIASVDNQGGTNARFVVQVHAVGPFFEQWLIDRYEIKESNREGMGGKAPLDPAGYPEDWDLLTDRVVMSTYKTSVPGREMRVLLTVVDTGGEGGPKQLNDEHEAGVTAHSYAWYRRLRQIGLDSRVMLAKGNNTKVDWFIKATMQGRRHAKDADDVPVYFYAPNLLKDDVFGALKREEPGPGYYHFPATKKAGDPPRDDDKAWLPASFFDELFAEVRLDNGTYSQIRKRNESLDLCVMIRAGCLRLGVDKITDWSRAPLWAQPLPTNSQMLTTEQRRELKAATGQAVAKVAPKAKQTKWRSKYLS